MPHKDPEARKAYHQKYGKAYREANREKIAERVKRWQEENKDHIKEVVAVYKLNNAEKIKARIHDHYVKNKESKALYAKQYLQDNFEKCSATSKKWRDSNKDLRSAYEAKRRFAKLNATPKWADLDAIEKFYTISMEKFNETGVKHHVDNIVPLNSKIVCGLHCEANLQVLIGSENIRKGNRVWPDMP